MSRIEEAMCVSLSSVWKMQGRVGPLFFFFFFSSSASFKSPSSKAIPFHSIHSPPHNQSLHLSEQKILLQQHVGVTTSSLVLYWFSDILCLLRQQSYYSQWTEKDSHLRVYTLPKKHSSGTTHSLLTAKPMWHYFKQFFSGLTDVAWSYPKSQRWRLGCHSNLCVLEWPWTLSWKSNVFAFALIFFLWGFVYKLTVCLSVLFRGQIRSCSIHQVGTTGRASCSSQDWSICLCWMEFWVIIASSLYSPSHSLFFILIKIYMQRIPCLAEIRAWYWIQNWQWTLQG